mmetsp:Transcript_18254/g.47681  ORF Transcript_18254/g.47681 Transcript_18254/m.47681 type:complete len:227 (+) Transcript_18254:804-1484(+)
MCPGWAPWSRAGWTRGGSRWASSWCCAPGVLPPRPSRSSGFTWPPRAPWRATWWRWRSGCPRARSSRGWCWGIPKPTHRGSATALRRRWWCGHTRGRSGPAPPPRCTAGPRTSRWSLRCCRPGWTARGSRWRPTRPRSRAASRGWSHWCHWRRRASRSMLLSPLLGGSRCGLTARWWPSGWSRRSPGSTRPRSSQRLPRPSRPSRCEPPSDPQPQPESVQPPPNKG